MKMADENNFLTCDICKEGCADKIVLLKHIKKNHLKDKCYIECPEKYADSVFVIMKSFPFLCKMCNKRFINKKTYSEHCSDHHIYGSTLPSKVIPQVVNRKIAIKRLARTYEPRADGKITCTLCSKPCKNDKALQYHLKRHHTDCTPVNCKLCGTVLNGLLHLKTHMSVMHDVSSRKKHLCKICNCLLSSRGHMKRHIKTIHSDTELPTCLICQKEYVNLKSLKIHMLRKHQTDNKNNGDLQPKQSEFLFEVPIIKQEPDIEEYLPGEEIPFSSYQDVNVKTEQTVKEEPNDYLEKLN